MKPMAGMAGMAGMTGILAALGILPISLASDFSGAITTTGTINAPTYSIFAVAANSLSIGEVVPADVSNGTTSAAGTRNASSRAMLPAAATRLLTCPWIPGLPIERCGGNILRMLVKNLTDLGMACLHNHQSGDTCTICFCAMFHANPQLQETVRAVDDILNGNRTAGEVFGAQMLEGRSYIDYMTNMDPYGGVKDLPSVKKAKVGMARWHGSYKR